MGNKHATIYILILSTLLALFLFFGMAKTAGSDQGTAGESSSISTTASLTDSQEAWIDRLELCESGGNPQAINPKDKDGTPSYYSFQFKPDTFRLFGVLYGVIPQGTDRVQNMVLLKDRDLQRAIVSFMILDSKTRWSQQFPACVLKLGLPPKI
jgi:hypothetical protein